jgi:ornithine carbamoyltransferase
MSHPAGPPGRRQGRHQVLDVADLGFDGLARVLALSSDPTLMDRRPLAGCGVALVFERPSARTRNATEMAVAALGGHPVSIQGAEIGIDRRETAEDVARTLACYHRIVCARVASHGTLERMVDALVGQHSPVPVVNLLSDLAHPCQALADLLTLQQCWGRFDGRTVAWVGDANNVWRSLAVACAMVGVELRTASPRGFQPSAEAVAVVTAAGGDVQVVDDPAEAVAGADAVYTDVWTSMGQEEEAERRRTAFRGYTVDRRLMAVAPGAVVLHCLPAHRGEEITAEVLEGPQSRVWQQAANRMHVMRGLLAWLVEEASMTDPVPSRLGEEGVRR